MVAEKAEYAFSARLDNAFELRDACGDGGFCVLIADAQWFFGIFMVAEIAEYAFSARIGSLVELRDGCRDGGFCVFIADAQCD